MKTKKCIVCGESKDVWEYFTKTNKDRSHHEVDICKSCRLKQLVGHD
jgi:hypothetical protein